MNTAQPVLLAVSGGRDSMVMADLFLKSGRNFALAHCNFQLRGTDADADEILVKNWCLQHNITFFVNHFETKKIASEWKKGIQETARDLRYDWFQRLCDTHNFSYIATAHHANDSVETLLINLFKGTGMNGLRGIPVQNGNIIRPLLFATRSVIDEYAKDHHIPYRDDASNGDDKYLRNGIRLNIIPAIERYFPHAGEHMHDSIQRFSQGYEIYQKAVTEKIKKLKEQRGKDYYIPILKLKREPSLETICYELFKSYGFSGAQVLQLLELIQAESGKFMVSSSHKIIKDRDFLILTTLQTETTDIVPINDLPGDVALDGKSFHLSKIVTPGTIPTSPAVAYIDMASIEFPLLLRKWRQGDYFYPLGMGMKKKKLGRFFIDQKIPLHEKEQVWVLESNKKIAWVSGLRLDERFKITEKTTDVLKIEMRIH
ncbi:MAG TPA: tRNA lysidine(34) synthetase TilS [Flavipsychrobacter sp.]|nr:tRNA lysidine(34) synthetase TilS [Flavipsychrobacter sp.]